METIFLHGFCETKDVWNDFLPLIHGKKHALDLLGFGENKTTNSYYDIADIAQDIIFQLDSKNIQQAVLVGHSLGGYVALEIAKQKPNLAKGIVMFHSTAFADSDEKKENRLKTIDFVKKWGLEVFADSFVPSMFFDTAHPKISSIKEIAQSTSTGTFESATLAMRNRQDAFKILESGVPIHYLLGENDTFVPLEREINLISNYKNITKTLVKKCAHIGFLEHPEPCSEVINSCLKKFRKYFV